MADADVTQWKVTGQLGDGANWGDVPLGEEVLLVVRATVARAADTLDDGATVRTFTVKVTGAARVGKRSTLAADARKLLGQYAEDDGKLL